MQKKAWSVMRFVAAFIVTYFIICFAVPEMRIKLDAEPMEYFLESIRFMFFMKAVVSTVVAFIIGTIRAVIRRGDKTQASSKHK